MPVQLPILDDRTFEQLLEEAKRRIPVHTPEWTNFANESDPGITLVQLFAFLTDNLLYRMNRVPELNRVKFLQLLGVPLQPAASAQGLIVIRNERGPLSPVPLKAGVEVAAGEVRFLTRDGVNVLPVEAQAFYKRKIPETDSRFATFRNKFEALLAAQFAAEENVSVGPDESSTNSELRLDFYETVSVPIPTASNPSPSLDLTDTLDQALYLALLAPSGDLVSTIRDAIANQTLSIGIVPALTGDVPPLTPAKLSTGRTPVPRLVYEIAKDNQGKSVAKYDRLPLVLEPEVLSQVGIVQVQLPGVEGLAPLDFPEPNDGGDR